MAIRMLFFFIICSTLILSSMAPMRAQNNSGSCIFQLQGGAQDANDPTNASNDVISINTTGGATGSATLLLPAGTKATDLDNQVSLNYYFVSPRTCAGGSPRIELAIDSDGDGDFDNNASGYVGNQPLGGGCPSGSWQMNDMTDGVARWDLSKLGGSTMLTWDQMETFLASMFPNYRILSGRLVDDSGGSTPAAAGQAYYDNLTIGSCTLNDENDTVVCTATDSDCDGVPNADDNCANGFNPDQRDSDGDGTGDVCDPQIGPPTSKAQCKKGGWERFNNPSFKNQGDCVSFVATGGRNGGSGGIDTDNDGVTDTSDNCPTMANPDQRDTDDDGTGDVCDPQIGPPTKTKQCKNGGWQRFNFPQTFSDQGQCIQAVKNK